MSVLASASNVSGRSSVSLNLHEPPLRIFADKVQIEQVLVNVLRNAIESMQAIPEPNRQLTISTRSEDGFLCVSIRDNGHGISPETLTRLFNPFFTTKAEGMGLGLSISRSIIEAHGGRMEVESIPGQGTTFSFLLPLLKHETES